MTKTITRYQVRQLQIEAGSAGDTAMVTACRSALASEVWPPLNSIRRGAYDDCAAAILDAASQDETHATPTTDGQLWDMVLGSYTTPADGWTAAAVTEALDAAIDQGLSVNRDDALARLRRMADVAAVGDDEITRSLYDEGGCLIEGLDPDVKAAAIQESLTSAQPEGWVRLPDGRRCFAH